jgi:hypothetical protein
VNRGHYFGTSSFQEEPGLSDDDKKALIEYLERLVHNAHRIECAANRCAGNTREGRKMNTDRLAKSCGKAAPCKLLETGVPITLGNPATDAGFPLFAQLETTTSLTIVITF